MFVFSLWIDFVNELNCVGRFLFLFVYMLCLLSFVRLSMNEWKRMYSREKVTTKNESSRVFFIGSTVDHLWLVDLRGCRDESFFWLNSLDSFDDQVRVEWRERKNWRSISKYEVNWQKTKWFSVNNQQLFNKNIEFYFFSHIDTLRRLEKTIWISVFLFKIVSMASAAQNSSLLFGFADKTLFALVPIPGSPSDKLYKPIGVISHGVIECELMTTIPFESLMKISNFQFLIIDRIKQSLFVFHLILQFLI